MQCTWIPAHPKLFDIVLVQDVPLQLALPPESPLIAQPPHDSRMGAAAMMHYTWGSIFTHPANKSEVWKFDKRFYTEASIQINVRASAWTLLAALIVQGRLEREYLDPISRCCGASGLKLAQVSRFWT